MVQNMQKNIIICKRHC